MNKPPVIVWFRRDLRLGDNPALEYALAVGGPIVPLFVWSPDEDSPWVPGGASRWWLHHSLAALSASLVERGSRLVLRSGPAAEVLREVLRETGARGVSWNRLYEPAAIARDSAIKQALLEDGIEVRSFNGSLLHSPPAVKNQSDRPFQVFTPFWKRCRTLPVRALAGTDEGRLPAPAKWPVSDALESFDLLPVVRWDSEFARHWRPGEAGAREALKRFAGGAAEAYHERRDVPSIEGTSRLSPHLHYGEIGPVQIHHALEARGLSGRGAQVFTSEVGWREFAHHLLFHFPDTPERPLRREFERFPWRSDPERLRAWRKGRTGYPIVDAGMRQLWRTGWMHNRVRMIVASFLVKHLLVPWQEGAEWFWDTLVDADLAANTLGWQWTAGCGADAAPYFRVFNPILQGVKFDPDGRYVRTWVPELARVPTAAIHAPWEASAEVLREAGVRLGVDYPKPIIDHKEGRDRALEAYESVKKSATA
jgi:deoxyribodipyrimidine photo-lyase